MSTTLTSGAVLAQAQSSLLKSRQEHVMDQIKSGQNGHDDARIEKGAREFESLLLTTWLQQAEQSMATVPGAEDDEDSGGRDQMVSLGVQSLATALTASGGIGIAGMISRALHQAADKAEQAAKPAETPQTAQTGK